MHTNTVILLESYCGTITEPGLPVVSRAEDHQKPTLVSSPPRSLEPDYLEAWNKIKLKAHVFVQC